jgi:hypothetical protein
MRMFVVSMIGLAGLASLFTFCTPLRDRARSVVFGHGTMALSSTEPAPSQPNPGAAAQDARPSGDST